MGYGSDREHLPEHFEEYKPKQINNMNNTFKGTITVIKETQVISDKFQKREFVITGNGMYPQSPIFQFVKDNCTKLDDYQVGQEVEVSYNLNGREWTNPQGEIKYFNTLEAWKIELMTAGDINEGDDLPR